MGLYYSIGALVVFYVLLIGEFFIPSAGMVGVSAVVAGITAIALGFAHSATTGVSILTVMAISTPVILYSMIKMWPHTPIGRRILNRTPGQLAPKKEHKMRDGTPVSSLVGQYGIAKTDLLPGGLVIINDNRMDAVSTGMSIDAGTQVLVVKTQAGKIHVRAVTDADRQTPLPADAREQLATDFDPEKTSLDSLDLESLE